METDIKKIGIAQGQRQRCDGVKARTTEYRSLYRCLNCKESEELQKLKEMIP